MLTVGYLGALMIRRLSAVFACTALLYCNPLGALAADTPTAVGSADVTASAVFNQGQTDRREWESWLTEQSGDRLSGASFWAAHRSLANPTDCAEAGRANDLWIGGCKNARERLTNSDRLRHSSPEYRLGWNSVSTSSAALTVASPSSIGSDDDDSSTNSETGASSNAVAPATQPVESPSAVTSDPLVPSTTSDATEIANVAAPATPSPQNDSKTATAVASVLRRLGSVAFLLLILRGVLGIITGGRNRAEEQLATLLLPEEAIIGLAIQARIYALFTRRGLVAVTTGRLIYIDRSIFGGYQMFGMRWQDIKDVKMRVGIFYSAIDIRYSSNLSDTAINEANFRLFSASGLVTEPAQAIYRECQAQEQSWREKRRVRAIEEMRAKAGGVQIANTINPLGFQTPPDARDPSLIADNFTLKLTQARDMKSQGLITDSEYEAIKARVVQSI